VSAPDSETGSPDALPVVTSGELRDRARETFELASGGHTPPVPRDRYYGVRDSDIVVELPCGVGLMLVLWNTGSGLSCIQPFRLGADRHTIPLVPPTRIPDAIMPALAGGVARVLDLISAEKRRWRSSRRNDKPERRPTTPARTAVRDDDPMPEWATANTSQSTGEGP
jgi:hypothetical protein